MAFISTQQLGPTDINTRRNVLMVAIAGDLDQASIEQDANDIQKIVDDITGGTFLLFDLTNLMYINSRSISYLVNWYMNLEQKGAKLCLFGLRPNIVDILDTTGIIHVIPVYNNFNDVKTAIESGSISLDVVNEPLGQVNLSTPEAVSPDNMSIRRIQAATPVNNGNTSHSVSTDNDANHVPEGPLSIARKDSTPSTPTTPQTPSEQVVADASTETTMSINRAMQPSAPTTSQIETPNEPLPTPDPDTNAEQPPTKEEIEAPTKPSSAPTQPAAGFSLLDD
jgi:anti-anti-sigma factor